MIRIRFIYDMKELNLYYLHGYSASDFTDLVNGDSDIKLDTPPFKDTESARVIRELGHAAVAEDDWFSIIQENGRRTCIMALDWKTRYALTVLAYSRAGFYTSVICNGYGNMDHAVFEIWETLADAPFDILLYMQTDEFPLDNPRFLFPETVEGKVVIENYRYKGLLAEGILSQAEEDILNEDGTLLIANHFEKFGFIWYRDFGNLIHAGDMCLEMYSKGYYKRLPLLSSLQEFVDTLELYHKRKALWLSQGDGQQETVGDIQVYNYLDAIPDRAWQRNPLCFVLEKDLVSGTMTVRRKDFGYDPSYLEFVACAVKQEGNRKGVSRLLIAGVEDFLREDEVMGIRWALKFQDGVLELYEGTDALEQFVEFAKEPYETGKMVIMRDCAQ